MSAPATSARSSQSPSAAGGALLTEQCGPHVLLRRRNETTRDAAMLSAIPAAPGRGGPIVPVPRTSLEPDHPQETVAAAELPRVELAEPEAPAAARPVRRMADMEFADRASTPAEQSLLTTPMPEVAP